MHSTLPLDCMVPGRSTACPSGWLQATELAHLDKDAACMSYLLRGVISAALFPLRWGKAGAGVWWCRNHRKLGPGRLFSLLSACSCLWLGQVLTSPHEWSGLARTERGKKEKVYLFSFSWLTEPQGSCHAWWPGLSQDPFPTGMCSVLPGLG